MTRTLRALIAIAAACAATASGGGAQPARPAPILILVSVDGWRWDYSDRIETPNLRALASRGAQVRQLVPSFPVLTFPNHYTIVTGLYPEHHGIVANTMVDAAAGLRFSMRSPEPKNGRWWGGEPLWTSVVRAGRRAAAMFWPGTEAEIHGVRPTYWRPYDGKVSGDDRVRQVIEWLELPEAERPSFVTLYFDEVDHAGHDFGPDAPQLAAAVRNVDRLLGTLVENIRRLGLDARTNIVVVSDHGMTALADDRIVWLEDYVDVAALDVTEWDGVLTAAPRSGTAGAAEAIYRRLRGANPHLRVFTRETMPGRLHYTASLRIAPIVGIPDDGWVVTTRQRRRAAIAEGRVIQRGTHGFDPQDEPMHTIFVAAGPRVARGVVLPSLPNVDVYDFLCAVLALEPAPNDGNASRTRGFLRR